MEWQGVGCYFCDELSSQIFGMRLNKVLHKVVGTNPSFYIVLDYIVLAFG